MRFDFHPGPVFVTKLAILSAVAVSTHMLVGTLIGPYAVGHERGSFEEIADIAKAVAVTGTVLVAVVLGFRWQATVPRSVPFIGATFGLVGMFASRFLVRTWRLRDRKTEPEVDRAIVFGAGEAGRRLTRSLRRDGEGGYHPVAILDDDRSKGRLRIEGIRVRGTRIDLQDVADRLGATTLIIALPRAHASTIRELTDLGTTAGLKFLTLPPLGDIIGGRPTARDLRDVDVADLL